MAKIKRSIVISIKPEFVDLIFSGEKTVELRKFIPSDLPDKTELIIYSTSPSKCIVGRAVIKRVERHPINQLWKKFGSETGITRKYFIEYFNGKDVGYGIKLEKVRKLRKPITLNELRRTINFTPPQSYMYASDDLRKALM